MENQNIHNTLLSTSKVNLLDMTFEGMEYSNSKINIDGKIYLIERHFTDERNCKEAIFSVIKNEAYRD